MVATPPAPAGSLETWMLCFGTMLGIIALIKIILPAPRKPPIEAEFATRIELRQVEQSFADRVETIEIKRSKQIAELHDKIDAVSRDVAFIRGKMEGT